MVQRFFLDRVDAESAGAAVGGQNQLIPAAGADETKSSLAGPQATEPRAQIALQPAVADAVPVTDLMAGTLLFAPECCVRLSHIKRMDVFDRLLMISGLYCQ